MIGFAYESDDQLAETFAAYLQSEVTNDSWEREMEYLEAELNRRGITRDNIKEKYPEYFI